MDSIGFELRTLRPKSDHPSYSAIKLQIFDMKFLKSIFFSKSFLNKFFSFPDLKPSHDNTLGKSDVKKESAKASVAAATATKTSTSEKKSKAKGQPLEAPLMLALAGYISYLVSFDI